MPTSNRNQRAEDDLPFMQMSEMLEALRYHGLCRLQQISKTTNDEVDDEVVSNHSTPIQSAPTVPPGPESNIRSTSLHMGQPHSARRNTTIDSTSQSSGSDSMAVATIQSALAPPNVVAHFESEVLPMARSLLPESALEHDEPMTTGKLSRIHLRLLVYAVSNDFAGLRASIPLSQVHYYIKDAMNVWLDQTACVPFQACGLSSIAPLAEGAFTCAIEAGDVDTVARLLSTPGSGLDVNAHFCNVDGVRYTAIERSALLQHLALTRLLLNAGAKVNSGVNELIPSSGRPLSGFWSPRMDVYSRSSPWPMGKPRGALECAVRGYSKGSQLGRELVSLLSRAGCTVGYETLSLMLDSGEDDILGIVLRAGLARCYEYWSYIGFFFRFAQNAREPLLTLVVLELIKIGVDLNVILVSQERNHHVGTCCLWEEVGWPPFWIDILAQRGQEKLVRILIENGVSLTPNVLVAATVSRHKCLIEYLLRAGALPETFSEHYRTTALAEAVRMQDVNISQIINYRLDTDVAMTSNQWCALLAAFAEVGDYEMLTCLVRSRRPSQVEPSDILGYALSKATRTGNERCITLLLEAGAATDYESICLAMSNGSCKTSHYYDAGKRAALSPLGLALKCRNAALIDSLLDHDSPLRGCIVPAIAWGDTDVIATLIASGSANRQDSDLGHRSFDEGLTKAVIAHPECVLLLLQAGWIPPREVLYGIISLGNMALVKECLDHGSINIDGDALAYALQTSTEVFGIALEVQRARTLLGFGNLGQHALDVAVDSGQYDVVKALLGLGTAQVPYYWARDDYSAYLSEPRAGSALLTAICKRSYEMIEMLLGARPVAVNEVIMLGQDRKTPLLAALDTCDTSIFLLVLQHNADINFPATRGIKRTPLQRAAELGSYDLVHLLLHHGANVNAVPAARQGATAFQLAAATGNIGIAHLLLEYGADVMAAGSVVDGQIALQRAATYGCFDMVVFLLRTARHHKSQILCAKDAAKEFGFSAIVEIFEDALENMSTEASGRPSTLMQGSQLGDTRSVDEELYGMSETSDVESQAESITSESESGQQRHGCTICGKSLSNASALRRHERNAHQDVFTGHQWSCGQCNKTFSRKDVWQRHEATHSKHGYTNCGRCGGSFRPDYFGTHALACQV